MKRAHEFLQEPLAEREGFEPPVPLSTSVFKTDAIDHSAISPKGFACLQRMSDFLIASAKVRLFHELCKDFGNFFHFSCIFVVF